MARQHAEEHEYAELRSSYLYQRDLREIAYAVVPHLAARPAGTRAARSHS